jgi:hypothetical protein
MDQSSTTSRLFFSNHACILSPHITSLMMERHEIPNISIPKFDRAYFRKRLEVSSSLGSKLLGDVAIGCAVTFSVVPFLTVVDTAIVRKAAGTHTLLSSASDSLKMMIRSPITYLKSPVFLFLWAVYAATYSTANSLKTIVEHREYYNAKEISISSNTNQNRMTVFVGTSLVNTGASLLKDRAYAKLFGTVGAAASVPFISLGLWATRDFMVIGSSFVLPDILSKHLQDEFQMHKGDAQKFSQMTLPILTQFIVGPIQLLGLDFYNRPMTNVSFRDAVVSRTRYLIEGFSSVVTARIIRIAPGYGIGGVLNTNARDAWRDYLIQREIRSLEAGKDDASELVHLVSSRHASSSYNE